MPDKTGDKPPYRNIFEAAEYGTVDDIRFFIESEGLDINVKCDNAHESLLQFALKEKQDMDVLKYLVENGADVNSVDKYGRTPLHSALRKFNVEVLDYMFDHDANINVVDDYGQTLLGCAVYGWTTFHYEKRIFDFELLKYLLAKGADINTKDYHGETLLHSAMRSNFDTDILKYLVDHGADIHATNSCGQTPLDFARTEEVKSFILTTAAATNKKK